MSTIQVKTEFNQTYIAQSVDIEYSDNPIMNTIFRHVVALQDEGIRKALIELGWTPPEDFK